MNDRCPHGKPWMLVAVAVVAALVAACTGSPGSGAAEDPGKGKSEVATTARKAGVGAEERVAAAVDSYLKGDLTGATEDVRAVLVNVGGRPLLERYHDSSAQATSGVFSVTKSVMSILVGVALDEGDLGSVEQTLAELLPDHSATMAQEVAGVTLRQILTMTAGFPADPPGSNPLPFETTDDWIAAIVSGGLKQPPGEGFAYASAGSHLLSAILVEATGRSVLSYAREKLFDPLGISTDSPAEPLAVIENLPIYEAASFAWPVDPQRLHLGHTYLKINAPDMAKIGQLMLDDGRWDGKQIVSTKWVTESTRAQVATGDEPAGGYGYQWWVTTADGSDAFAAAGFGGQLVEVVPALDLVVVVSSTVPEVPRLTSNSFMTLVDRVIAPAVAP